MDEGFLTRGLDSAGAAMADGGDGSIRQHAAPYKQRCSNKPATAKPGPAMDSQAGTIIQPAGQIIHQQNKVSNLIPFGDAAICDRENTLLKTGCCQIAAKGHRANQLAFCIINQTDKTGYAKPGKMGQIVGKC